MHTDQKSDTIFSKQVRDTHRLYFRRAFTSNVACHINSSMRNTKHKDKNFSFEFVGNFERYRKLLYYNYP